ncbi:uncharacterized protein LOC114517088 [Dendronephthya gigantea]|uniref:uncharacterized protein LOC114517088 n=1 Tax=Dendronephthya gigantea TaxID=151771 RepID=UPI00106C664D|nr:uncharacterized protein LOC114517088 [Dendronephthya gigantea]
MSGKGRFAEKAPNLGEFRFIGGGDGDHEGSLAFSDISFPSHVSDLESFHSDLDVSINSVQSRESMSAADDDRESSREQLERRSQSGGDNRESFGKLPDLPEKASENVDVLLAALKAATLQDSSSERSIDSNKSGSSNSNQDSTRFISRESFPESVLAEASQSWVKESGHLGEGMPADKPPSAGSEERDTSLVKPSSDSRLSEKFLAPSKTPDNGRSGFFGADKSDRSPWSFSGDSLWFQTPTPARPGDSVVVAKNDSLSNQLSGAKAKPSSSSTPVEENPSNKSLNQSNQFPARASLSNDTFPPQKDRLSEMDFSVAAYNPFDASYDNAGLSGGLSTKPSSERNTKPSSSSTPVGVDPSERLRGQSSQLKSNLVKPSISKDVFPSQQDAMSNMDFSTAAYNPFDGSLMDRASNAQGMEIGSSMFGDGDGFVGDDAQDGFSFQTADDAAKRLDQDEKIFEENHRFDKEDAMIDVAGKSFSYYILPGESSHRSPSIIGVNDPNDKGEVRISFGEFFAAKTGELGRLSDVNEDRPRPQFSDTRDCKVSPTAIPPRQLYRPSSPEGSERDTSYQPSFADLDKDPRKWARNDQSQAKEHVAMAARSLPCGAEADDEKGRGTREGKGAAEEVL